MVFRKKRSGSWQRCWCAWSDILDVTLVKPANPQTQQTETEHTIEHTIHHLSSIESWVNESLQFWLLLSTYCKLGQAAQTPGSSRRCCGGSIWVSAKHRGYRMIWWGDFNQGVQHFKHILKRESLHGPMLLISIDGLLANLWDGWLVMCVPLLANGCQDERSPAGRWLFAAVRGLSPPLVDVISWGTVERWSEAENTRVLATTGCGNRLCSSTGIRFSTTRMGWQKNYTSYH